MEPARPINPHAERRCCGSYVGTGRRLRHTIQTQDQADIDASVHGAVRGGLMLLSSMTRSTLGVVHRAGKGRVVFAGQRSLPSKRAGTFLAER